jgi:D-inositol-3-phosphate glycosyltransferase
LNFGNADPNLEIFKYRNLVERKREGTALKPDQLQIAMFSIHSSPIGELGTKNTGGMSVYIRELARQLGARGHCIDIYTRLNGSKHNQIIDLDDNVRLIHLSAGNNGYVQKLALYYYLSDFFRALQRFKQQQNLQYDLIHSHYWLSGRLGNWVQDRWNLPHIIMFHTLGTVKNIAGVADQEPDLRIATEKKLAKTCQRILAPTAREKNNLLTYYKAPAVKIGVVPCGVNLDLFQPMDRAVARQRLGFDDNESIVLYVGRFDPIKGIDRLLKAATHLQDRRRLRLVIIGGDGPDTPEYQNLQKMTRKLGLQNTVTFVGRIEQKHLPPYYSAADVLVVPSYYESFGLVGLESLACGTPVVATEVGAMRSILQEGQTGRIVTRANPRSLAQAIETFITGSGVKKLSADMVRASVLKFGWSNVAAAVIDEYDMLFQQMHYEALNSASAKASSL